MTYQYRDGFRPRAVDAATAYREMERLRKKAPLTAKRLFEAARPQDSPLHGEFIWDGEQAVQTLGELRARELVRAVVVRIDDEPAAPPRHAYVHVPDAVPGQREGAYVPLSVLVTEPDAYGRAIAELTRKFAGAEAALAELRQAAGQSAQPDRLAAIGLAAEAFATARQALAVLAA